MNVTEQAAAPVKQSHRSPAAMVALSLGPLILLLAAYDALHSWIIRPAVLPVREAAAALASSVLLVCAGTAVIAAVEVATIWAHSFVSARVRGRFSELAAPALAAACASPLLLLLARQPFIGNRYRASPIAVWGPWVVLAAMMLATVAGLWLGARMLSWLAGSRSPRRWARWLVASAVAGTGAAILAVDTLWFAGWYPLVHSMLSVASLVVEHVLLTIALVRHSHLRRMATVVNRFVIAMAIVATGIVAVWSDQTVKWRVMTGTLYASRVITPALLAVTHRPALDELRTLPSVRTRDLLPNPAVTTVPPPLASNAVLITVDALRFDALGLNGSSKRLTPNIDAFFKDGTIFQRTYSQFASTRESVRAILESRFRDEPREDTNNLINRLRDYHYQVVAVLPNDVRTFVNLERYNFTKVAFYEDPTDVPYLLDEVTSGMPPEKRFVWVHFYQPHDPYEAPAEFRSGDSVRDRYDAEVRWVDDEFPKVVKATANANSIVVFGADHGEEFHEHGGTLHGRTAYDETLRVPLEVRVAGAAAEKRTELTANVDIAPTLLGALGIPVPDDYDGYDLLGRASVAPADRVVYSESVTNAVTALQGEWKWVHWTDFGLWEAYNLRTDPREIRNLASDQAVIQRGRPLIARFELPWFVLPGLRRTTENQYAQWLRDLLGRVAHSSNLERLVAYDLASGRERNATTRQLLGQIVRAEPDPALKFVAMDSLGGAERVIPATLPQRQQMDAGLAVETLRHADAVAGADALIRTTMSDPIAAVRRTAAEELARRDGAAGVAALMASVNGDSAVRRGLLTGLETHASDLPPGVFRAYIEDDDVDVRAAAIKGIAAQEQQRAVPILLERRAFERSPSVVRVILDRLLAIDRAAGLMSLRAEIAGPMLSNYARAQLIVSWNVAEEADHLGELFAHSGSNQFRAYLFNAVTRLHAPTAVVRRVVETMNASNFDPTLRARMNRFLKSAASQAPGDENDEPGISGKE